MLTDPRETPHQLYGYTMSLCSHCGKRVTAKILLRDGAVWLRKLCPEHGEHEALLEEDAEYYVRRLEFDKPGTASHTQTAIQQGCPHDCGLCPQHEQHTCIAVLDVTERCNLACPVCFARSGTGADLDLPTIDRMLDLYQQAEDGKAEILQISGGEPTLHPQILDIIRLARAKRIRYVMLNTNGLRLADDLNFVRALTEFRGGFEVYLQFDGFDAVTYRTLRGRDLREIKERAVTNLSQHGIPITLVTTVQRGINEHELGRILHYGMETSGVRGVNIQPLAYFGRYDEEAAPAQRLTLTGVLRAIEAQTHGMIRRDDFIPLPCNVDRVAITYLHRGKGGFMPITRNARIKEYLPLVRNSLDFDAGDILKQLALGLFTGQQFCQCLNFLRDFLPVAPIGKNLKLENGTLKYAIEDTFRISVTSFLDRENFEMRAMQKECVHVLTPDLRRVPFSAYQLFYRQEARDAVLS